MGHLLIASDNVIDECTLSGGAWTTGLPLPYLQTRQVDQKARTVSALKRDAWFYAAAPSTVTVAVAALIGGNFSEAAQWRLRGWNADPRGVVDAVFTAGALPSGWAVTRATSATYFDADGVLQTAGNNVARFEYSGGVCEGLLLEEAATNYALHCRDGTNAAWTKVNMTTALDVTGLDAAANTATRLTATAGSARISQAPSSGDRFSVWLKRISGTGTVSITGDGFGTTTTCTLTTAWQRFSVARSGNVGIDIATSGDVVAMDFAQCETGTAATSPIATAGTSVARNTDELAYAGINALGATFTTGCMLMHAELIRRPLSSTPVLAYLGASAGASESINIEMSSAGVPGVRLIAASTPVVSGVTGAAVSNGAAFTAAVSWEVNDVRGSFDGAAVASDTVAPMPTGTAGTFGVSAGACMYLRRLKLYSEEKTDAQLVALSGSEQEVAADTDTGWLDAWPADYLSGTPARARTGAVTPAFYKPAAAMSRRYWRIDVDDEANADGYIEFGRPALMWSAFQPEHNANVGAGITFESRASSVTTDSGARYFVDRPAPRLLSFDLPALSDDEMWQEAFELMRREGATGEAIVSLDPDDSANLPRQTFLATLDSLPKLQAIARGHWSAAYVARELL